MLRNPVLQGDSLSYTVKLVKGEPGAAGKGFPFVSTGNEFALGVIRRCFLL
jgi:hypothetical protein